MLYLASSYAQRTRELAHLARLIKIDVVKYAMQQIYTVRDATCFLEDITTFNKNGMQMSPE